MKKNIKNKINNKNIKNKKYIIFECVNSLTEEMYIWRHPEDFFDDDYSMLKYKKKLDDFLLLLNWI